MIEGLFETHLFVTDLARSANFYDSLPGLTRCYSDKGRKALFYWIGKPQSGMLGLWEKPLEEVQKRHFAFCCSEEFIVKESAAFLNSRGLTPYNFLKDETESPMVFAWMPAVSVYFDDPDGHILEFIAVLKGLPAPELGVISYDEWTRLT